MISAIIALLFGAQLWLLASSFFTAPRLSGISLLVLVSCMASALLLRWGLQKRGRPSLNQPRRLLRLVSVVLGNLDRNRNHFALAGVGIVVGIATFVFFISLGEGVRKIVLGEIFPIGQLEIVPPKVQMSVGPLQLGGDTKTINDAVVKELREIPGVKAAFPKMKVAFPARAWGGKSFIGKNAGADLIADGVDPELVAADIQPGEYPFADLENPACEADADCGTGANCGPANTCIPKSCTSDEECGAGWYCDLGDKEWPSYKPSNDCHKPIPVLISSRFFELMNTTFLPANGFPKVNKDFFVNRLTFSIYLGYSNLKSAPKGTRAFRKAIVVGFSPRAIAVGLTVPLPYVKRWNAEYSDEKAATSYNSVLVEIEDKGQVTAVAEEIKNRLGLDIEDSGAEKAGLVITIITLIFSLISVSIVGIAAINIMHTFLMLVSERKREIGILRSLGASRSDVRGMLLTEAAIVGFISGVLGVLLAYDITLLIDYVNTTSLIPDFPFKPKTYFVISPELVLGALAFAVGCCVLGAYLPARNAAAIDPARALTAL
jgi:putative ABC transport system permease protein